MRLFGLPQNDPLAEYLHESDSSLLRISSNYYIYLDERINWLQIVWSDFILRTAAIIVAAGKGARLGTKVPKQFLKIKGKPLLYYTIEKFQKCSAVDDIILVTPNEQLDETLQNVINNQTFSKVRKIVAGGNERYHSVYNGLRAVDKQTDIAVIHDGVRPFISISIIEQAILLCIECGAVVVAVPVKDTIKEIKNGIISHSLRRTSLWAIQTPQVFKYSLILEAYNNLEKNHGSEVTDDAMLVESLGYPVKILKGKYSNIKVTSWDDFEWARFVLETGFEVQS